MKASIIIPAYNIEDGLERCVRSVLGQTLRDLEVIIVDDGSTDATGRLADELAASEPNVRVIHQPNGGTSRARNAGIRAASGEYLGFVDADDCVEPRTYEILLDFVMKNGLKCAQVCRDEIAPDGSPLPMVVTPPDKPEIIPSKDFLMELLMHRGDCSMCTKLTHRSLFEFCMFPDGELNEDFYVFTAFLQHVDGVGSLPDVCYHVCYRMGSNTRTDGDFFSRVFRDIVVNADRAEEMVARTYPDLKEVARRFALVQRLDYMMHVPLRMMTPGDGVRVSFLRRRRHGSIAPSSAQGEGGGDDDFYAEVVRYLRRHRRDIRNNPYLTSDQRSRLKVMSACPKTARTVHSWIMKLRKR